MTERTIGLGDIERSIVLDREGFVKSCEREYHQKVLVSAEEIARNSKEKPLVMLSGPSGSGKTTTAFKLREAIQKTGHPCYVVSMDDYFKTVNPATHPHDENGQIDFESPYCLDIELFNSHIELLRQGGTIGIPHFDFPNQRRHPDMTTPLSIGADGICIFEGIHALNPLFSRDCTQKVYVSARANIVRGKDTVFKGTWVRLIRRMVRDSNFRGWEPKRTLIQWASVRRGEKKYISPYHGGADMAIDTHMPYEVCAMRNYALPMLADIPDCERAAELRDLARALAVMPPLRWDLIPLNSLLREFVG